MAMPPKAVSWLSIGLGLVSLITAMLPIVPFIAGLLGIVAAVSQRKSLTRLWMLGLAVSIIGIVAAVVMIYNRER